MKIAGDIDDLVTKRRKSNCIDGVRDQYAIEGERPRRKPNKLRNQNRNNGEITAEYIKHYKTKNRDRIKEQRAEYRYTNKDKIRKQKAEYRNTNKDKIRKQKAEYRNTNKDKIREHQAEYRNTNTDKITEQKAEYRNTNKDRIREHRAEYVNSNKNKIREQRAEYRNLNKDTLGSGKKLYRRNNRSQKLKENSNYKNKNYKIVRGMNAKYYQMNRIEMNRRAKGRKKGGDPPNYLSTRKRHNNEKNDCTSAVEESYVLPKGIRHEWRNSYDFLMRKKVLWKEIIKRRLMNDILRNTRKAGDRAVIRSRMSKLLDYELDIAFQCEKRVQARLRKAVLYLRTKYDDACACLSSMNGDDTEAALQGEYGGLCSHSRTNERYCSDPGQRKIFLDQFYPEQDFVDDQGNISRARPNKRHCDNSCCYPHNWGMRFHEALSSFNERLSNQQIRALVIKFDQCDGCIIGKYPECNKGESCEDWLKLTREVSIHFQHMRTIQRKLYEVRQCQLWLMKLESIFNYGGYIDLHYLIKHKKPIPEAESEQSANEAKRDETLLISYQNLQDQWGEVWDAYTNELKDLPRHRCALCGLLSRSKDMAKNPMRECPEFLEAEMTIWLEETDLSFPMLLCKACNTSLRNSQVPDLSIFNNLGVDTIPDCLRSLNDYEKLMIQLAKVFQTVVKLKPYKQKQWNSSNLVTALKGLAVHLPLPIENTMENVMTTLPSREHIHILVDGDRAEQSRVLVDGIPTKEGRIWRSLVNIDHVVSALDWLKVNNLLYKNINIEVTEDFKNLTGNSEQPTIFFNEADETEVDDDFQRNGPSFLAEFAPDIMKQYTVTPLQQNQPLEKDSKLYSMQKINAPPVADRTIHLDMMCFPDLYPRGRFGIFQQRPKKLSVAKLISSKLKHHDPRYRQNLQFLYFCLSLKDKRAIDSGIYASLKASKQLDGISAGALMEKVDGEDEFLETKINQMFRAVVGSREYWYNVAGDLKALVEMHGSPTFFLTLSAAEYHWPELRSYLEEVNPHIPNIERVPTGNLCAIDPVSVVRFFEIKFRSMMKNVIRRPEGGPLGVVEHYFWRREYQARGAPHFHILLWIKGAPQFGENSNEAILDFLKGKLSCNIPDRMTSPKLHTQVMKHQHHKCSGSCMTMVKRGGIPRRRCRYGFPRTTSSTMKLNKVKNAVQSRDKGGKVKKLVELIRNDEEKYINDYCPAILIPWAANMDVQFVGEMSMVLVNYLTAYVTKGEKNSTESLWKQLDRNKSFYGLLKSFAIRSLNNRECGAYEASDKLLGHAMHGMSQSAKFLDARLASERARCLKSYSDLKLLPKEDQNIYRQNLVSDYYPDRPASLSDVSIYDICARYEFEWGEPSRKNHFALKTIKGYFRERLKPCLVKTPYIKPVGDGIEKYFHQLLFLFKPWRSETEIKMNLPSYQEAFESVKDSLPKMMTYDRLRKRIIAADELSAELRATSIANEEEQSDQQVEIDNEDQFEGLYDPDPVLNTVHIPECNESDLYEEESHLNVDQRSVYDMVIDALRYQRDNNGEDHLNSAEALKLFVSGVAGTGKSHLINLLKRKVTAMFAGEEKGTIKVAILAPTGLAAFNVGGTTIHRFFKLPVQHGCDPSFWKLQRSDVKEMRMVYKNLKLIIIDEISMVSNMTLAMIHSRLDEIFGGSERGITFGGRNVVVLGDLLQLPPVNSDFCFQKMRISRKKHVFNGVGIHIDLWDDFSYYELTINMRQAGDKEYAELLNRIRVQVQTKEDVAKLNERLISQESVTIAEAVTHFLVSGIEKSGMTICPLNRTVDLFNLEALRQLNISIVCIKAHDTREQPRACQVMTHDQALQILEEKHAPAKKGSKKKMKTSDTGGLEELLMLGLEARVMLRKNIDQEKGLINGALGTLKDIICNNQNFATHLKIEFDGILEAIKVERSKAEFELRKNVRAHRSQFPVSLAFAMTVHKSQGLSLNSVLLDIGEKIFDEGMIYVALSRARNYEGVHIMQFESNKIMASIKAVTEYNRLRQKFTDLPAIYLPTRMNLYEGYERKKTSKVKNKDLVTTHQNETNAQAPASFIKFSNPKGVACYANSLLQLLLKCDTMYRKIQEEKMTGGVVTELETLNQLRVSAIQQDVSAGPLMNAVVESVKEKGGSWDLDRQMDVHEFWLHLLQSLPPQLQQLFQFEKREHHVCVACEYSSFTEFELQNNLCVYIDCSNSDIVQFKSLFKDGRLTKKCSNPECPNEVDKMHFSTVEYRYPENNKYVMMQMNLFRPDNDGVITKFGGKINGFGAKKVNIMGVRFEAMAAVKHEGHTIESGHYTAVVYDTPSNLWHEISDTTLRMVRHQFPPGMKDIYLVLLKRM